LRASGTQGGAAEQAAWAGTEMDTRTSPPTVLAIPLEWRESETGRMGLAHHQRRCVEPSESAARQKEYQTTMTASQLSPSEEKTWAMFTHFASLSGGFIPFGNIVGPVIVWTLKKNESDFVDRHGKNSVNFRISLMIWLLCCIPLCFGIPLVVGLGILGVVYTIINGIRASNGEESHYPLTIRFVK
jgi:uncharacterized Tic20 family protein